MKVVIDVDLGGLTDKMARDMLAQLNRETSSGMGFVRLESPWGSFPVTKVEVPDA